MESEKLCALHARVVRNRKSDGSKAQAQEGDKWRRQCGCIRTSEKLKEILKSFPSAPPPTPTLFDPTFVTAFRADIKTPDKPLLPQEKTVEAEPMLADVRYAEAKLSDKTWNIIADLVHLVQLSVTATALALYYVIYCYMQLIYYTLRSALYFHNADGPMKITIGVVTITSVIIGFNLLIRMEKMIGIYLF